MKPIHALSLPILVCLLLISAPAAAQPSDAERLAGEVREAERAFARTMAERDFEGFQRYLSEEAVFISGETVSRGRSQVAGQWQDYYLGETAPFSWEPETVVVLASGDLALSTGPVFDADGNLTAYYSSTWRREAPGVWRVVFDRGFRACGS